MKHVFLAGAGGNIGRVLLHMLVNDPEIVKICVFLHKKMLDIDSNKIYFLESKDGIQGIDLLGIDTVYNCVGEKINESKMYETNVEFSLKLLHRSKQCNVKNYVYLSSVGSYGALRYANKVSETTPSSPKNFYESTKKIAEDELLALSSGIRILILQPSNVLSTFDKKNALLPYLTKLIRIGIVVVVKGKDGWLNYVSDEYVANVAVNLPKLNNLEQKYIINTPIRYSSAISILASFNNVPYTKFYIASWFSDSIYKICNFLFRFIKFPAFDAIARKLYEIDNDVFFQSKSHELLDSIGKVSATELYVKIAKRNN